MQFRFPILLSLLQKKGFNSESCAETLPHSDCSSGSEAEAIQLVLQYA